MRLIRFEGGVVTLDQNAGLRVPGEGLTGETDHIISPANLYDLQRPTRIPMFEENKVR